MTLMDWFRPLALPSQQAWNRKKAKPWLLPASPFVPLRFFTVSYLPLEGAISGTLALSRLINAAPLPLYAPMPDPLMQEETAT